MKNLLKPLDLRFFFSCEKSKSMFPTFFFFVSYDMFNRVSHAVKFCQTRFHHTPTIPLSSRHPMPKTPELERIWLLLNRGTNTFFKHRTRITYMPTLTMLVTIHERSHAMTASFLSPIIHSFILHQVTPCVGKEGCKTHARGISILAVN